MSFLLPSAPKLPDQFGSRLESLSAGPVGYGKNIPIVYGIKRMAANLLAQMPIAEHVHTETVSTGGGKGGGGGSSYQSTTYTYSCTFAVILCSGPVQGIRRIWMNGKLFYENRPFMGGKVLREAQAKAARFRLYKGNRTQQPDPVLQSHYGASSSPAYRGRAYIVFDDLDLTDFGNRIPVVEVEIVESGTGSVYDTIYPYAKPLREVVGDLCVRSGLTSEQFDVTELDQDVTGFSIQGTQDAAAALKDLARIYHFYPVDDGEKLVFSRQPTPLFRPEYDTKCMINEDGLVANAYHDVLGRDGYFPESAGTSEGQFVLLHAAAFAVQATGDAIWAAIMTHMAGAVSRMYNGAVPFAGQTDYAPHWLFTVRRPEKAQSSKMNLKARFTRTSQGWEATIPAGFPGYGERVVRVTRAHSDDASFSSWSNPYASIIGQQYGEPSRVEVSGAGAKVTLPAAAIPGSAARDANLVVIYDFGPWIDTSQNIEAWPHWRPIEPGEIDCALDTLKMALEAYDRLYQVTGDSLWLDSYNATASTVYSTFDVDDGRWWVRPTIGSALSQTGSFLYSERSGFSEDSLSRDARLRIVMDIPKTAGDKAEAQFGRGINDKLKAADTHIRLSLKVNMSVGGESWANVDFYLQSGPNVTTATRYYYRHSFAAGTVFDGNLDVPLSAFSGKTLRDPGGWQGNAPLLPGTQLDVVGLQYDGINGGTIVLGGFRPLPEVTLPYVPNVAPYTANYLQGAPVDWRGGPGIGYQDAGVWAMLGEPARLDGMLDFLADSQAEYHRRYGVWGPFVPAYVWDRYDVLQDEPGNINAWSFQWPDPNSEWVGYTARAVAGMAMAGHMSGTTRGLSLSARFIGWLAGAWTDTTKYIPTNYPEQIRPLARDAYFASNEAMDGWNGRVYRANSAGTTRSTPVTLPMTIGATVQDGGVEWRCAGYTYGPAPIFGDYDEPHAAALFMRAALSLHAHGVATANAMLVIGRCWAYLERLWAGTHGDLVGTWSHNPDAGEWFGFWGGEIVTTLCLLLTDFSATRAAAGIDEATVRERIAAHGQWLQRNTRHISTPDLDELTTDADFSVSQIKEMSLPKRVEIKYQSMARNGNQDFRFVEKRSSRGVESDDISTDIVLTGEQALKAAQDWMLVTWASREEWEMELLGRLHRPGDVIQFKRDGQAHTVQLSEVTYDPDGKAKVRALSFDPSVYAVIAPASPDPKDVVGLQVRAETEAHILEVPLLRDEDDVPGYYSYASASNTNWRGGALLSSPDDVQYSVEAVYVAPAIAGITETALPAKLPTLRDTTSRLVVVVKGSLESVSEAAFLSCQNVALVGGEIILFKNAELISSRTYELSDMLRGRLGTEAAIEGHAVGEQFVFLDGRMTTSAISASLIGVTRFMKGITAGQAESEVQPFQYATPSARLLPYSPVHLKAVHRTGGYALSWVRRTRKGGAWRDHADVPLGEESLRFSVTLMDESRAPLKTYLVDEEKLFVTEPEIIALYGSLTANKIMAVAQISAIVGPGNITEIEFK